MNKGKIFLAVFSIILLISTFACRQKNKSDKQTGQDKQLTIDTFSILPPEINGCSCLFSNDSIEYKNDKYIYVNSFTSISFVKVNGAMIKFSVIGSENVHSQKMVKYTSENYEMTIEIKNSKRAGYESSEELGAIKLSDRKGNTLTKVFYGICGC